MPIRINLLAEEQELEDLRKRDPVKRAIQISVAVLVLMLVWVGYNAARSMGASKELQAEEARFGGLEKGSKMAQKDRKDAAQMESKYDSLQKMASERFLWAPVLDSIYKAALPEIDVMNLRVEQKYHVTEKKPPANKADPKDKGKPATSRESIRLVITARDFSKGESNYDKFINRLTADAYLKEKLAAGGVIKLGNLSDRVQDFQDANKVFRNFSVEIEFPEKIR